MCVQGMTCIVAYRKSYFTRPECSPFHDHTETSCVHKQTKLVSREQQIWGFWSGSTPPYYIHLCKNEFTDTHNKIARVCLKNNPCTSWHRHVIIVLIGQFAESTKIFIKVPFNVLNTSREGSTRGKRWQGRRHRS